MSQPSVCRFPLRTIRTSPSPTTGLTMLLPALLGDRGGEKALPKITAQPADEHHHCDCHYRAPAPSRRCHFFTCCLDVHGGIWPQGAELLVPRTDHKDHTDVLGEAFSTRPPAPSSEGCTASGSAVLALPSVPGCQRWGAWAAPAAVMGSLSEDTQHYAWPIWRTMKRPLRLPGEAPTSQMLEEV